MTCKFHTLVHLSHIGICKLKGSVTDKVSHLTQCTQHYMTARTDSRKRLIGSFIYSIVGILISKFCWEKNWCSGCILTSSVVWNSRCCCTRGYDEPNGSYTAIASLKIYTMVRGLVLTWLRYLRAKLVASSCRHDGSAGLSSGGGLGHKTCCFPCYLNSMS